MENTLEADFDLDAIIETLDASAGQENDAEQAVTMSNIGYL